MIYYLNPSWRAEHGGELQLWPEDDGPPVRVAPRSDRLLVFISSLEHEARHTSLNSRWITAPRDATGRTDAGPPTSHELHTDARPTTHECRGVSALGAVVVCCRCCLLGSSGSR